MSEPDIERAVADAVRFLRAGGVLSRADFLALSDAEQDVFAHAAVTVKRQDAAFVAEALRGGAAPAPETFDAKLERVAREKLS